MVYYGGVCSLQVCRMPLHCWLVTKRNKALFKQPTLPGPEKCWSATKYFFCRNVRLWQLLTERIVASTQNVSRKIWRAQKVKCPHPALTSHFSCGCIEDSETSRVLMSGGLEHFPDWIGFVREVCCGQWGSLVCAFFVCHPCYNTLLLDATQLSTQLLNLLNFVSL